MALRKKKEGKDIVNVEEKKQNKLVSMIIVALIILIWLGILVVLVKLDVGNFGSKVLRPIIKDVPVLKEILPAASNDEIVDSGDYPYKSLAEAIAYIKELELELQDYHATDNESASKIEELQAEIDRLKIFEENNLEFEEEKSKFYEEVVFGDDAIDIENYKQYYESIDAENAAKLYKQVVTQKVYEDEYADYAKAYSSMKPSEAAKIFLKTDINTVVGILKSMSASNRGSILGALGSQDAEFAAKVTQMLAP